MQFGDDETVPQVIAECGPKIKNNRERQLTQGEQPLPEVVVPQRTPLDLRNMVGRHVEVYLNRDVLAAPNTVVQKRRLYGTRMYTGDSDILLALVHDGWLVYGCQAAGYAWPRRVDQVRAIVDVMPSQEHFVGCESNGITSRSWHSRCCGFCFRVDRAWLRWSDVRARPPLHAAVQ